MNVYQNMTFNKSKNLIIISKGLPAFYSFWLCYKVKLKQVFNYLEDNGKEKDFEQFDLQGNSIIDNHYNLFNLCSKK